QIGLILVSIVLPPVRLLMLLWWVASMVISASRRRELPQIYKLAYRLHRPSSRFSKTGVLFGVGTVGTVLFGIVGPAVERNASAADLIVLYGVGGACLILAVVTGHRLWRRWQARRAAADPL